MERNTRKARIEKLIRGLASDTTIIPGIHNYCDRWCERCTHTAFCSVYKMEMAMDGHSEDKDIINQQFWDQLSEMLEVAAEMLRETMEEMNIDPNEIIDKPFEKPELSNEKAVVISREYTFEMSNWLKANREAIYSKIEQMSSAEGEKAQMLADTFGVIQYYFMIISTKTYRCFLPSSNDENKHDALGSAKIALIMIDRSIASWFRFIELLAKYEDDALSFLSKLTAVKRLILEKYPDAMEFKRPGFDN